LLFVGICYTRFLEDRAIWTNSPKYAISLSRLDPQDILKKLHVKHYEDNILNMTKAQLLKEFGKSAKTLNKSLFIKNVIWQTYEKLQAGETPFDIGNIRSFWYYIKDTMDRIGANKKGNPYLIVSDMFMVMVKAGLFKYKDFRFNDDNKENRWHARTHPNVILLAEKTSYKDLLQEITRDFDITTLATGGQPSYLSIEYFVDELRERGVDLATQFMIFSIVDFDPAGDIIATTFVENLQDNGIKNVKIFPGKFYKHFKRKDLAVPANMTKAQCKKTFRIPLKVRKSGLAAKWAARTGGVNGKKGILNGIECSNMPYAQIMQFFILELAKVITIDLESIAKYRQMQPLKTQMQFFALKKLQLGM